MKCLGLLPDFLFDKEDQGHDFVNVKWRQGEKEHPEVVDWIGGEGINLEDGIDARSLDDEELEGKA